MRWTICALLGMAPTACASSIDPGADASVVEGAELIDASDRPERPDATPPPDAAPPCTEGDNRVQDPATFHCYILVTGSLSWDNARTACAAFGSSAHLVTLGSSAETDLVDSLYGGIEVWAGGTDRDDEGNWRWITDEPMPYFNWSGGEPNNDDGEEHCMVLRGEAASRWDDRRCNSGHAFVCERD
jgi:hypothetical protein